MQDDLRNYEAEDSKGTTKDRMVQVEERILLCVEFGEEMARGFDGREDVQDDWAIS